MSTQSHFRLLRVVLPMNEAQAALDWFGFDANGGFQTSGSTPVDRLPSHDTLEVVVPAGRIAAHRLSLPARPGRHLDALIAQALEDRVLGERADVLAVPGAQEGSQRLVWVLSRRWFEAQLARLAAAGLRVQQAFVEYDLLPPAADATSAVTLIAATSSGLIFRTPDRHTGFVADERQVAALIGDNPLKRVAHLHHQPRPTDSVNLLVGPLAGRQPLRFDPRSLRRAALLLALSVGVLLVGQIVRWRQLESREYRLHNEIRQTFATRFPGTPIVDPILQWESKQREQQNRSRSDALDAVLALASRINAPIHPRRIESRDALVRITLPDSEVTQFKGQLDNAGAHESAPAEAGLTRLQYKLPQ